MYNILYTYITRTMINTSRNNNVCISLKVANVDYFKNLFNIRKCCVVNFAKIKPFFIFNGSNIFNSLRTFCGEKK